MLTWIRTIIESTRTVSLTCTQKVAVNLRLIEYIEYIRCTLAEKYASVPTCRSTPSTEWHHASPLPPGSRRNVRQSDSVPCSSRRLCVLLVSSRRCQFRVCADGHDHRERGSWRGSKHLVWRCDSRGPKRADFDRQEHEHTRQLRPAHSAPRPRCDSRYVPPASFVCCGRRACVHVP
jgi:hypothetical protein